MPNGCGFGAAVVLAPQVPPAAPGWDPLGASSLALPSSPRAASLGSPRLAGRDSPGGRSGWRLRAPAALAPPGPPSTSLCWSGPWVPAAPALCPATLACDRKRVGPLPCVPPGPRGGSAFLPSISPSSPAGCSLSSFSAPPFLLRSSSSLSALGSSSFFRVPPIPPPSPLRSWHLNLCPTPGGTTWLALFVAAALSVSPRLGVHGPQALGLQPPGPGSSDAALSFWLLPRCTLLHCLSFTCSRH